MKLDNRKFFCIFLLILLTASTFASIEVTSPIMPAANGTNSFKALVPSANFTCRTFDRGIDTDSNGLYNYLEIKVEVNVSEQDLFHVAMVGLSDGEGGYLLIQNETTVSLDIGIHNVTILLYGPNIAANRFNPAKISWINLMAEHGDSLYKYDVPLSRQYSYTEFDSPFTDCDVILVVYPDGRVVALGTANATHIQDPNDLMGYLNFVIKESQDGFWWTNGSFLFYLPKTYDEFPFNSTYLSHYTLFSEGLLYSETNATMLLPSDISQIFPLNVTDLEIIGTFDGLDLEGSIHATLIGNLTTLPMTFLDLPIGLNTTVSLPLKLQLSYDKGEYNGSLTVYLLEDFPVKFFDADFTGNLSSICLNGSIDIIYGEYGPPLNMTITYEEFSPMVAYLNEYLNETVFNMTGGMLEAPVVNLTFMNITMGSEVIGATVSFEVCIREVESHKGMMLFTMLTPILEEFSLTGSEGVWLLHAFNDTLNKIQNATLELTYTPSTTTTELWINGTIHVKNILEQLLEPITPPEWWPWEVPPEINSTVLPYAWAFVKALNATLSSFEDASIRLSYLGEEGKVVLNATSVIDLNALENSLVRLMPELETCLPPMPEPLPPLDEMMAFINTSYVDVTWSEVSISYSDSVLELQVAVLAEGDLNDEVNHVFHMVLESLPDPPSEELFEFLNATYLDVSDSYFNMAMEFDSITGNMSLAAYPPTDPINATSFHLTRLFNFTSPPDFPDSLSKLSIKVEGGSNATHVVLVRWPGEEPMPDVLDPYGRFVAWNNVSICNIAPLVFTVISNGPPTILNATVYPTSFYRVTQNVTVSAIIVNDLTEETPELTEVYMNLKMPSGSWVNDTYRMTYNGTHFKWSSDFGGNATGNYVAVIKTTDLYGQTSMSAPLSFTMMNNPPQVTAITIQTRTLNIGENITGSVTASDVEGSISVKASFYGSDGWHNVTATLSGTSYTFSISTSGWSAGDYTVYATATDTDGTSTVYQDPQKVTLTSPLPIMLIVGALGAVAAIVAALLLWRRGKSPA
jgi:hypothetical protein